MIFHRKANIVFKLFNLLFIKDRLLFNIAEKEIFLLLMRCLKNYKVKKQAQLLKVGLKLIEDHFVVSAFGGEPANPNKIHKQFLYAI